MQNEKEEFYNKFKSYVEKVGEGIKETSTLKDVVNKFLCLFITKEIKHNNLKHIEDLDTREFIEDINRLRAEEVIELTEATKMKLEVSRLKRESVFTLFKQALGYKQI